MTNPPYTSKRKLKGLESGDLVAACKFHGIWDGQENGQLKHHAVELLTTHLGINNQIPWNFTPKQPPQAQSGRSSAMPSSNSSAMSSSSHSSTLSASSGRSESSGSSGDSGSSTLGALEAGFLRLAAERRAFEAEKEEQQRLVAPQGAPAAAGPGALVLAPGTKGGSGQEGASVINANVAGAVVINYHNGDGRGKKRKKKKKKKQKLLFCVCVLAIAFTPTPAAKANQAHPLSHRRCPFLCAGKVCSVSRATRKGDGRNKVKNSGEK